ncbi:MAG TPA: GNAT family N-acetyltransferase [Novimethylophilus sp.]|uniref:GNAT family N-acetyltransferase n=1 Tax=Novimethylophilus sp. TaxID=2137426 RepID=UPI002F4292CE
MTAIDNLIEPGRLIEHFLDHPPQGFSVGTLARGIPVFSTPFDLLTTMEPADRRRLETLPFSRAWRCWLRPHTCFVGATCTEYAPLPAIDPNQFLRELLQHALPEHGFVIVKDIPAEGVLVGAAAFARSRELMHACGDHGFILVEGQSLAYVPLDFADTEEFLARMSKARRKDLKRKLKSRAELEVAAIPTGDACFFDEATLRHYYALYLEVFAQSEIHFDLLTPEFFRAVLQDAALNGVVFAYHAEGELIGYNLCFVHNGMLLDKYVGFRYPQARRHNLYMVSWFHNLQYALEHGLTHYVAGWTDPEVKRQLGASFTQTRHAVHIRNPLVRNMLKPFKRFFESDAQWTQQTR